MDILLGNLSNMWYWLELCSSKDFVVIDLNRHREQRLSFGMFKLRFTLYLKIVVICIDCARHFIYKIVFAYAFLLERKNKLIRFNNFDNVLFISFAISHCNKGRTKMTLRLIFISLSQSTAGQMTLAIYP